MHKILLEVCVDDVEGLAAAIAGGADRIELCSALCIGGLTPSVGMMRLAAACPLPAMVMIRPRTGNFVWSQEDILVMETEIAAARQAGVAGVVIGASLADGRLDAAVLRRLVAAAENLDITLHRCIDLAPDAEEAVHTAGKLGIRRILTSGGAQKAISGLKRLVAMQRAADDDIVIMPGSGVNTATFPDIAAALPGLSEIHASCAEPVAEDPVLLHFGFALSGAVHTQANRVAGLRAALDAIAAA